MYQASLCWVTFRSKKSRSVEKSSNIGFIPFQEQNSTLENQIFQCYKFSGTVFKLKLEVFSYDNEL